MTPEEIQKAVQDTAERLAESDFLCPVPGPEMAEGHIRVSAMSPIEGVLVQRQQIGGYDLLYDENGNSAPGFPVAGSLGGPDYHLVYDDNKGGAIIDRARNGDAVARSILLEIAAVYVATHCVMPERLRDYIVEQLQTAASNPTKGRGRQPFVNFGRDFWVGLNIDAVACKYGLSATRNRASTTESACSIVQKALAIHGTHLSESAVEKVWDGFQRHPLNPSSGSS